jgi:acetyltransferase-like isoleucine patch superfamily enzyme
LLPAAPALPEMGLGMLLRSRNWAVRTWALLTSLPYRRALGRIGSRVVLSRGFSVNHPDCVFIDDDVFINEHCWMSLLKTNAQRGSADVPLSPVLRVGSNSYIGRFVTFACMNEVTIGKDVMIADRVFIGDCHHGFVNRELPIKDQYLFSPGPVRIGDGSWIGVNAAIMPNVSIGRNCVIGANSVVTADVSDFHIAAGSPARILRQVDERPGAVAIDPAPGRPDAA